MSVSKITFRILRYKPGRIDPARFQDFDLHLEPDMSVLDALETIRLEQDRTLMYRHSCHHSSCGTCACRINGEEGLTCITKLADLAGDIITLTPLEGFKPIADLVVDMTRFFEDYSEDWSYLRPSEKLKSTSQPSGIKQFTRFENCIECGSCISACPVTHGGNTFVGPAVLAAVSSELKKTPQNASDLLVLADSSRGVRRCERAVNCSRRCPSNVYPARHIADLRRMLENKNQKK
jgi:succinate dehydrogenase / fumarate reductase iron-sulfur subunit